MSINPVLVTLLVIAPPAPEEQPEHPRLCKIAPGSSVQLAYKPYGSPVFGSDGLTCFARDPAAQADGRSAASPKARKAPGAPNTATSGAVRSYRNVENGP